MADDISRYNELKSRLDQTIEAQKEAEEKFDKEKLEHATAIQLHNDLKKQNERLIENARFIVLQREKIKETLVTFISQQREEVDSLKQNLLDYKSTANDSIKTTTTELVEQFNIAKEVLNGKHNEEIEKLTKQLTEATDNNEQITKENMRLEKELDRVKSDLEYVSNSNNQKRLK